MNRWVVGMAMVVGLAGVASADPVAGVWRTAPGETGGYLHVNIAPCGSAICGRIDSAYDKSGTVQSDYEHLGKKMLWDMSGDGEGYYSGGKIWAPDADKTYASKMSLSGNTLEVKGCVAGGLICRGQDWTRIK
ncbi:DUF2147 domain-containing protein [Parasedimentitalea maritima]|uniref:DUF2147 domain-containing protein n=1 Tax=Parasedimentitalea maritima TaxID=2578117 RepID=A0ABY2UYA8_9RHOB|nr:DUF2147 domain-containing protein [Zongyanglinia marina]TLP67867.1 DUF2147 domain-containing protein [Zongyanglinia marina]